jgi:hypothetical protein
MGSSPVGIATMPMDYGQSLQVNNQGQGQSPLMSQAPNYSSATSITTNPLLNYGQSPLADAGGTPLTMRSGGITRLGYANGDVVNIEDQMMQQAQQPQQPQQPPLQGMEGQQPDIKDPKQALDIIIQMLIAQGIPPEQAREIALQMVQAVSEGGMQEMSDERVEARFGGYMTRQQYGLGSIVSGIGKAIGSVAKGVTNAVSSVVKSPIGKAALTIAAIYASGGGSFFGATPFPGATPGFAFSNLPGASYFPSVFGTPADELGYGGIKGFLPSLASGDFAGAGRLAMEGVTGLTKNIGIGNLISAGTGFAGGLFAGAPQQQEGEPTADFQKRVAQYNAQYSPLLNPTVKYPGNPFYPPTQLVANGGRIGYQEGGIGDLIKQTTQQAYFGTPMMAMGGRMGYAMGKEVPTRENQAGVKELDYRDTGGFVPPIGIKERADDIPAMLSNNEFVFTADAVRNAGGGDENLGAQRMYTLMKQLESGGSV